MSEWKEARLGDICTIIGRIGFRGYTAKDLVETPDKGAISLSPTNIANFELNLSKVTYISWEKYYESPEIMVAPGDIVFSKTGTVGWSALIKEVVHPITLNPQLVVFKDIKINPVYLSYVMRSHLFKGLVKNITGGSAVPTLTQKDLGNLEFPVADSETQEKIASILSSLDDKIAVNKKICENLEAQAQALFKHWFVDFVHFKDGKFVESELGMIPLSIICEQITDGVHNSVKDEPNSSYMLLSCKNIVGGVLSKNNYRSISKNTFDSLRLRTKLAKGDILISSVGTIGEITIVEEDPLNYEFQRSVAIVKPKEKIGTYFLYNALLASKTRLQHAAHGAVQQCLFLGDLKKFKVNCYDIEKAFLYNETVKPLFEEIAKLHQESDRLSTLRDTLLPKLMSGQIKV